MSLLRSKKNYPRIIIRYSSLTSSVLRFLVFFLFLWRFKKKIFILYGWKKKKHLAWSCVAYTNVQVSQYIWLGNETANKYTDWHWTVRVKAWENTLQPPYRRQTAKIYKALGCFHIIIVPYKVVPVFAYLTHCRLNEITQTIYWKSLILILGMSGYVIFYYILLEKNSKSHFCKQCGPSRSSLIRVHTVCLNAKVGLKSLQEYSADDIFRCRFSWHFKG